MEKDKDLPFNALIDLKPNIPRNKKNNCDSVLVIATETMNLFLYKTGLLKSLTSFFLFYISYSFLYHRVILKTFWRN